MMEEEESLEEEINDLLLKLVELEIEKKKVRSDLIIKTNKLKSTIAVTESNFRVGQWTDLLLPNLVAEGNFDIFF